MNKKTEMQKFKAFKKKQTALSNLNDNVETFLDPILDKLAIYMDLHFKCDDFMKELCK